MKPRQRERAANGGGKVSREGRITAENVGNNGGLPKEDPGADSPNGPAKDLRQAVSGLVVWLLSGAFYLRSRLVGAVVVHCVGLGIVVVFALTVLPVFSRNRAEAEQAVASTAADFSDFGRLPDPGHSARGSRWQ